MTGATASSSPAARRPEPRPSTRIASEGRFDGACDARGPDPARRRALRPRLDRRANPDNAILLDFGEEGLDNPDKSLFVASNTFVNDFTASTFIDVASGATLTAHDNLFVGPGTPSSTGALPADNLSGVDPLFVDPSTYDYHLKAGSPALGRALGKAAAGVAGPPGTFSLTPAFEYVQPLASVGRPNAHDLGAFEYGTSTAGAGMDASADPAGSADAGAGGAIEVPLDELEHYYSVQYGVGIAPDKSRIFVTASGSDVVTVIDTKRLLAFAHSRRKLFVNDLSASSNYVITRIAVGKNPRGVAMSPNGKRLYVANRMDDTLSVIDTASNKSLGTIDLGGSKNISALRRGEQLFTTSRYAFQGQFSCANCHIDSTFDGLTWDLEPDGFGKDIVDNRLIEDLAGTEPFKWNGGNPSMAQECGPRTEMYFYRSQSYSPAELADLVDYIYSLPPRPNRFRIRDGELTAAQERGKAIFDRTVNKFGKAIAEENQCAYCHSGPKHTSQKKFDVGTGKWTDRSPIFDTPQLVNIALTAPYLHDESARSLEEIWTVFNPHDQHGATNDLTKDELNDLIEYLRTL